MYGNDRGGFGGPRRVMAPVKVGEELDVTIEAVGEKGDGIAKKQGFVLFVPNTKEGDTVRVRVTRVLHKVGFADVIGEAKEAPKREDRVMQPPARQEAPEDTEDFGEESESSEDDSEEMPADEESDDLVESDDSGEDVPEEESEEQDSEEDSEEEKF